MVRRFDGGAAVPWWCGEVSGKNKSDAVCLAHLRSLIGAWYMMVKGLDASRGVRALPAAVCWVQCLAIKMRVVASLS